MIAQGMELEQTDATSQKTKKITIEDKAIIKLIDGLFAKPDADDPIKAMGTGGNSGGNTPPQIGFNVIGDNKKVIIEFYSMFEYALIDKKWKRLSNEEYSQLLEYSKVFKNGP